MIIPKYMKPFIRFFLRVILAVLIIFMTIILVHAFDARKQPDLEIWHKVKLSNEFCKSRYGSEITYQQYTDIEDKLYSELEEKVFTKSELSEEDKYNRYVHSSLSCPDRFPKNWNHSFELVPDRIEGGILLIHGLTDSPYSMKSLAEIFYEANFYVLAIRMPGHGTVPAALEDVSLEDWIAAVEIGARHVTKITGTENPFYIAGYSNGGALSLLYALESLDNDTLAHPDRLFLFSPAIGITKFASMAKWLEITSGLPYFEKSKWRTILPEYDPFKYNSFPLNAADLSYKLSMKIKKSIQYHHTKGSLEKLPPVITFQSVVDSTIITADIAWFYNKLNSNRHELILFDINQKASLQNFIKNPPLTIFFESTASDRLNYKLTIITNKNTNSEEVVAKTKEENANSFEEVPLKMSWPKDIYSLSHIAIPFPMNDPLYGIEPGNVPFNHIQLGDVSIRGERNVLRISEQDLMRLRCNPFWDYIDKFLKKAIAQDKQCRIQK